MLFLELTLNSGSRHSSGVEAELYGQTNIGGHDATHLSNQHGFGIVEGEAGEKGL